MMARCHKNHKLFVHCYLVAAILFSPLHKCMEIQSEAGFSFSAVPVIKCNAMTLSCGWKLDGNSNVVEKFKSVS